MTGLAALQLITAWIQAIYNLKIHAKLSAIGNTTYVWKVLSLPIHFFSQRMAGDIQSRQAANAAIAGTMVYTIAPLSLNTFMVLFYLILMLRQNTLMTAIGLGTMVLNIILSAIISGKRVHIERVRQRDSAKLDSETVTGIEMI
ncbi:MAG: hypothetical protein IKQ91_11175 [Oscillospiraceae bacterium]|nr:hypothetical protein [Oscillospiraceae bacterium]